MVSRRPPYPPLLRLAPGLWLAALLAVSCSQVIVPIESPELVIEHRVPLLVVPGITGTALRDPATGKLAWGDGKAVIRPHDGGYGLVQPIPAGAARPGGALQVAGVLTDIRLGPIRKEVYGPIVTLLENHGYTHGDLRAPQPGEDLFLFGYDWREENAVSAARLADSLERLRRARGEERLEVDLVCQSNGAHVCRWFAKYGGGTLEEAETGVAGPPARVRVRKLILVSSSNGGSLRNLTWFHRGRRYVSLVGRRWSPEAIFSLRSLFEDLPIYRQDLFLDAAGEPLAVDLFAAESWQQYGWSVFSPRVARRLERSGQGDLFGDAAERRSYLARALDRARRFHQQLRRDIHGFGGVRYYLIQDVDNETPERAILTRHRDGWRTRFPGDRWLRRRPRLEGLLLGWGDGHAAVESQRWMAPQELKALAAEPARVDGDHFELILAPAAQRWLLRYLADSGRNAALPVATSNNRRFGPPSGAMPVPKIRHGPSARSGDAIR
jgi:hypothetical protein